MIGKDFFSMRCLFHLFGIFVMVLCIGLIISGCGIRQPVPSAAPVKTKDSYRVNGQWYHPITDSSGFRQSGIASWYGAAFHGKTTANGETYNMHAATAAHKTLPLGTYVLVRSLDSGKKTVVRINDRGPFVRGRIIDLSYKAAKEIDMIGPGTAFVRIAAMEKGRFEKESAQADHEDFHTGDFTVQVGAFVHKNLAERLRDKLGGFDAPVFITTASRDGKLFYRVRMGRYTSLEAAEKAQARLIRNGYKKAFAVAGDEG